MFRALFKTAAILWILWVGFMAAQGAMSGPEQAFVLALPALALFLFLTFLPRRRARQPQPVVVAAPAAAAPAPPPTRGKAKMTLLILVGAVLFNVGLQLHWVEVFEETSGGGRQKQVVWKGTDLKKKPFDERLPAIAKGLGAVSVLLIVARTVTSGRKLSLLVVLAGLACLAVNVYVVEKAQPGTYFPGIGQGPRTFNELRDGFFVTLAGGALLLLGGLGALFRGR